MSDFTLTVPPHIVEQARRVAEGKALSVEYVLIHELENAFETPFSLLPEDERRELEALTFLSDDALWTIAREQMPMDKQERMSLLMDANSRGTITPPEHAELSQLVEDGQRLMLRKGQAAALLTQRGYVVTSDMLAGAERPGRTSNQTDE